MLDITRNQHNIPYITRNQHNIPYGYRILAFNSVVINTNEYYKDDLDSVLSQFNYFLEEANKRKCKLNLSTISIMNLNPSPLQVNKGFAKLLLKCKVSKVNFNFGLPACPHMHWKDKLKDKEIQIIDVEDFPAGRFHYDLVSKTQGCKSLYIRGKHLNKINHLKELMRYYQMYENNITMPEIINGAPSQLLLAIHKKQAYNSNTEVASKKLPYLDDVYRFSIDGNLRYVYQLILDNNQDDKEMINECNRLIAQIN